MSKLIIPLDVSYKYIQKPESVVNATGDFSNMPWSDGTRDYNEEFPYIGSVVHQEPFNDSTYYMGAGIHLHFLLPRALRKANKDNIFPAVPNRWLVNRIVADRVDRSLIIESDYLSDQKDGGIVNPVNVPILIKDSNKKEQPYKYMGRVIELGQYKKIELTDKYWLSYYGNDKDASNRYSPLSAIGYGEVSFSTFYPNSRSAFGFYDNFDLAKVSGQEVRYEVIGWYQEYKIETGNENYDIFSGLDTVLAQEQKLKDYHWNISNDIDDRKSPINSTYYHGEIKIDNRENSRIKGAKIDNVSIGYSSVSAVSGYLAKQISSESLSVEKAEEQLESIIMSKKLSLSDDFGAEFRKYQHQKSFRAEKGGILWRLKKKSSGDNKLENKVKSNGQVSNKVFDDKELAKLLNDLNKLQNEYDKAVYELEQEKLQLYFDWNKYIRSCYPELGNNINYPDSDEIKYYINNEISKRLIPLFDTVGVLSVKKSGEGDDAKIILESSTAYSFGNLASQIVSQYKIIINYLNKKEEQWLINYVPSSRYYKPADPVIAFFAKKADYEYLNQVSKETVECFISDFDIYQYIGNSIIQSKQNLRQSIGGLSKEFGKSANIWHPQFFEWQADIYPINGKISSTDNNSSYSPLYIKDKFKIELNKFDFEKEVNSSKVSSQEYKGRGYFAVNVRDRYIRGLKEWLVNTDSSELKKIFNKDNEDEIVRELNQWLVDNVQEKSKAIYSAVKSYIKLSDLIILSQSLSGFYDGFLQQRDNINLQMLDPLGFKEYQEFTSRVSKYLLNSRKMEPLPEDIFNPIIAGSFKINQLRIIDHFGSEDTVDSNTIISSNSYRLDNHSNNQWLAPRLVQGARINFRWLSAESKSNNEEINSIYGVTPICGFISADYWDNTLVIYDNQGGILGNIYDEGWFSPIGAKNPITQKEVINGTDRINSHFLKVLQFLLRNILPQGKSSEKGKKFFNTYLNVVEQAQDNIYPANNTNRDIISLLSGKAIAIVRASIDLEVKGGVRVNQSWNALRSDLMDGENKRRHNAEYDLVKFPVRLGEYKELNDGLIGYWIDNLSNDKALDIYHTNIESYDGSNSAIVKNEVIYTSIAPSKLLVIMMMDPRSAVHITTGILPNKAIDIPPEYYINQIEKLDMHYLISPLITSRGKYEVTMPADTGKKWQWLSVKEKNQILTNDLAKWNENANFANQNIEEGYIKLLNQQNKKGN